MRWSTKCLSGRVVRTEALTEILTPAASSLAQRWGGYGGGFGVAEAVAIAGMLAMAFAHPSLAGIVTMIASAAGVHRTALLRLMAGLLSRGSDDVYCSNPVSSVAFR
jgi:hypothetical protein